MATFPDSFIRSDLVLNRKQVEEIDEELRSRWKLFCPASNDPRAEAVFSKISEASLRRLETHHHRRFSLGMTEQEDLAFYDEIATPPFGSWVCQSRRSYIIDAIVAVDTYIKIFRPLKVIELGTGLGFGASTLARRNPSTSFVAIDRSAASIKVAHNKTKGVRNVTYICSDLVSLNTAMRFDLAFTLAGIPVEGNLSRDLVGSAVNLLRPSGVLMGYSTNDLSSRRREQDRTIGLVLRSIVAGFEMLNPSGGAVWSCAPFEVFQLGAKDSNIYCDYNHNSEEWPRFAKYVNANSRDFDRHTFAYAKTA